MATPDLAAPPASATGEESAKPGGNGTAGVFVAGALIAAFVAAALAGLSLTEALSRLGIPDPGPVTTYGLPILTAIGEVAAVVSVGSFLLAAFLVPPQRSGVLDVDGYRAVRTGSVAAAVWAACAFVLVPLELSQTSGKPFTEAMKPSNVMTALGQVESAKAWLWTAALAAIVAVGSRVILRWGWTPLLLLLSIGSLMPLALTGHSSAGGNHDLATNSLILHLVSASLWAGGLFALLAHARRRGAHTDVAVRRYSAVATVCLVVIGISGVLNAMVRMPLSALFTTNYGWMVFGKVVALVVLGLIGLAQRGTSVRALQQDPSARGPLIRLAGVEVLVFAATIGLAVGLSGAPPPPDTKVPSVLEVELGYNLSGPPTLSRLLFDWRFDLIFGTAAIVLAVVYLLGVRRLRRRGDAWPIGRTVAWIAGCAVLLFTTSSGVGRYMPAMFSVHMAAHMALSMLAPVLLVLGGPITLALRALKPAGKNGVPGPREWLLAAVHSPVSKFLTHPLIAAVLFVGGFYALYLGGIFGSLVSEHAGHLFMNLHFLLSGYLFYWVVIGIDPAPRRLQPVTKLGVVMGSLPFHAFFGVTLMMMNTVLGYTFYKGLNLPWNQDLLSDQHVGASVAWAAGEVPLVVIMVALLIQWSRSDTRTARQMDRAADRDDDADLAAHNAMFAELARRDREAGL
ncbi:bifunctional copper resistance protein CopD/cytochrome c oxidase assembly protein [Rhodococcus sp. D2-41]|uniref:bifunctional copper resistance protein CopD/cytochrome c oxidase assembly protein n=1 Tax=Speluncibacter jeojiensis TaxID=2710754 RepID=UPI00240ED3F0|nr:bifunctional copper resistance protein CopD/cytochrome c oxidase assembly protein [Rhodococcus sp. D2-41]MDG3008608.1 bifunctional copper resistance protein CopD/cytochrome c oxidase assembly protein [Rhodococcus sp. D2-41]